MGSLQSEKDCFGQNVENRMEEVRSVPSYKRPKEDTSVDSQQVFRDY